MHPINAKTGTLVGTIEGELGDDGVPRFELEHGARLQLAVETMKSGHRLQDMEMQRRMDVRRYPQIEVVIDRAWQANRPGRYRASVKVTAHGQTRSFEEDFSMQVEGRRLVIEGEHTFDMRDFDVNPPNFLALKVHPEVRVRARIVAEQDGS
jgi:polyisoprenoid-binding protein YceI